MDVVDPGMFRALVESAVDPMFMCDAAGRYLYVNEAAAAVFGMRQADVIGRTVDDLFPGPSAEIYRANARRVIETGETLILAEDRIDTGGETRWFSSILHPLRDPAGRIVCAHGVVRDITSLKKAELALRDSDQRLRQAVRVAHIGIFEHDHSARTLYLSPELRQIFGLRDDDYVVMGDSAETPRANAVAIMDFIHPDDRAAIAEALARAHDPSGAGLYEVEQRHTRPNDGSVRTLHTRAQTFFEGEGADRHAVHTVGAVRDVTEIKGAEQALRASEERLRQAVRLTHIGIFEHDHRTNRIYLSPENRQIIGVDDDIEMVLGDVLPGQQAVSIPSLVHPDDVERVAAAIRRAHDPTGDGYFEVEYRQVRPNGEARWVISRSQTAFEGEGTARRPVRTVGASRDITDERRAEREREALQAQLSQAQKMESVGRLAGGVAHDFNNMLNVILGWSSLALDELEAGHALHEPLREIHAAAERSAALTRQLLAFARRQPVMPKVLDLNDLVARSLTMLGRLMGEDVQLVWNPGRSIWPVRIDPSQVDQILANLAANARDAIVGVGRVNIATANVTLGASGAGSESGLAAAPGDYVLLRVSDDGSGTDAETRAHVFEPFYTTKPPGQGTGLGLATVYGIVRQNDGAIHFESAVGQGTTVWIYLPRFAGASAADAEHTVEEPPRGRETILLVEDEPLMLELSRTLLNRLGYRVLSASGPAEAIDLAAHHVGRIDLLFTDVVMPAMSGVDLAEKLVAAQPNLKCLFASGHYNHRLTAAGTIGPGRHFLQKPFAIGDLAAKVRQALDDRS